MCRTVGFAQIACIVLYGNVTARKRSGFIVESVSNGRGGNGSSGFGRAYHLKVDPARIRAVVGCPVKRIRARGEIVIILVGPDILSLPMNGIKNFQTTEYGAEKYEF